MKIYLWDNGWRGATFYIANSKEEAIEYFSKTYAYPYGYNITDDINEYDITLGLAIDTRGDG